MGPNTLVLKATSAETAGGFFLSESTIAPGFPGPPPHVHERLTDMFYVLEGTLTLRVGDEEVEAGPGTFACFPPGTTHTFSNRSDEPARFLNFNIPGGWEDYMRELVSSGAATPAEIGAIAARYDFRAV